MECENRSAINVLACAGPQACDIVKLTNLPRATMYWVYNAFMKFEGKLKDGKRNGTWKFYKRDGSLQKTVTYKNGVEVKK